MGTCNIIILTNNTEPLERMVKDMKITNLKKRDMNAIIRKVTAGNDYKWYCKIEGENIIIGNNYFSENEYYIISNSEEDYVGITLNYTGEHITGIIIDPSFSFADFNDWCIEAFEKLVRKCRSHFNYYV